MKRANRALSRRGSDPPTAKPGRGPVDTRPKSLARATERRRVDRLYHAIAEIVGPVEARRLADLAEAGREDFEIEWLEKNRQRIEDGGFDTDTTA